MSVLVQEKADTDMPALTIREVKLRKVPESIDALNCSGPGDCAWCHPGSCFGCLGCGQCFHYSPQ